MNTAPSREVSLLGDISLRPLPTREKKIKALERDVIFFLSPPPPGFLRGGRIRERDLRRETNLRKNHPNRFFHLPEEFITVQLLPLHHHLVAFFSYIISSSSPSFASFIIPPSRFYRLLIRCLYSKGCNTRRREKQ